MSAAWEVLCAGGVPAGAVRPCPAGALDQSAIRDALAAVCRTDLDGLDQGLRECLLAWLRAFEHHWPDRFASMLGDVGRDALARLAHPLPDPNRYLKLRRIAIENLAAAL